MKIYDNNEINENVFCNKFLLYIYCVRDKC